MDAQQSKRLLLLTILAVIEEAREVPSGLLYSALMAKGMSFATYTDLIGAMKSMKLITESGFLLKITPAGRAILAAKKVN